jgi:hypothetical protein
VPVEPFGGGLTTGTAQAQVPSHGALSHVHPLPPPQLEAEQTAGQAHTWAQGMGGTGPVVVVVPALVVGVPAVVVVVVVAGGGHVGSSGQTCGAA